MAVMAAHSIKAAETAVLPAAVLTIKQAALVAVAVFLRQVLVLLVGILLELITVVVARRLRAVVVHHPE